MRRRDFLAGLAAVLAGSVVPKATDGRYGHYPPVAIADHTAEYTSEYRFGYTTPDGVFHGERYSEAEFRAAKPRR